jgi:hypothetical protein
MQKQRNYPNLSLKKRTSTNPCTNPNKTSPKPISNFLPSTNQSNSYPIKPSSSPV